MAGGGLTGGPSGENTHCLVRMPQHHVDTQSVKIASDLITFDRTDRQVASDDDRRRNTVVRTPSRQIGQIFTGMTVQAADQDCRQVVDAARGFHELFRRRASAEIDDLETLAPQIHGNEVIGHDMRITDGHTQHDGFSMRMARHAVDERLS